MNRILIDTMYIEEILSSEETPYINFADAIDNEKIIGISSVVSITELIKNLGLKDMNRMHTTVQESSSQIVL